MRNSSGVNDHAVIKADREMTESEREIIKKTKFQLEDEGNLLYVHK